MYFPLDNNFRCYGSLKRDRSTYEQSDYFFNPSRMLACWGIYDPNRLDQRILRHRAASSLTSLGGHVLEP